MTRLRIGVVILPEHRWQEGRALWQRAEALGFDHAWTYDHLAWRSLRDSAWFSAIPTLTAAAAATRRIRLGTLVASPNFRHPVPFARELLTLDDVSAGRLTVGIGAGGTGFDAKILGQPEWSVRERADRFVEFVELLDRLLREPAVSFGGRFYAADEARGHPGCVQRPRVPFAIAAGRDPGTIACLVLAGPHLDPGLASRDAFAETVGRYAEAGVTDFVVPWPRPDEPYAGDPEVFERIFSDR